MWLRAAKGLISHFYNTKIWLRPPSHRVDDYYHNVQRINSLFTGKYMSVIKVIPRLLSLYKYIQRISRDPDATTCPVTSIRGFRNVFFLTSVFEKTKTKQTNKKKTLNSKKYLSDKFELIKMKGYNFYLPRHTCSIFGQTVLRSIFHPKENKAILYRMLTLGLIHFYGSFSQLGETDESLKDHK